MSRRARLAAPPSPPAACRPDGTHWHPLYHPVTGEPMPGAIEHEWLRSTGHPTGPDPRRPHFHLWDGLGLVRGPSVAERPGDLVDNEERDALSLHPELRPPRLRDA